jgi:formylglycine-generating enzyme required for sulfatase activity
VPAGEFKMGSSPADNWAEGDEQPQRVVNLPAFYIDALEITQLQYKQFVDASGWPPPRDWKDGTFVEDTEFLPVTGVTWWDANAYARWAGIAHRSRVGESGARHRRPALSVG